MADVVIGTVRLVSGPTQSRPAGAVIGAGSPVTGNPAVIAKNDTQTNSQITGIAIAPAEQGGVVVFATKGARVQLSDSAVLNKGQWYFVSAAGGIMPHSDLSAGVWSSCCGFAYDGTTLEIQPIPTDVTV